MPGAGAAPYARRIQNDVRQLGAADSAGQAGRHGGQGGRGGVPRGGPRQRIGDRRQGRAQARPRAARAACAASGRGARLGDERQDHHHAADRGGPARHAARRVERARREHARGHHVGAGLRLGREVRRDRGRREVPRGRRPRHRSQGHRAAQPLARPARPCRRDPHARREVARGPGRFEGDRDRERGRPAGRLGRVLLAERGVGRHAARSGRTTPGRARRAAA